MKYGLIAGASCLALATAATAQPLESMDGDVIVVTGQKIDRTLQETATSVRVYDLEAIEEQNFINLFDILDQTANVSTGFDDSVFTIRGVRNAGAGLGDVTSDVSTIYVDGVFLPRNLFANGALNLWDISSVEIFRGPQSTIQGRNALAGAIVIDTVDPSTTEESLRGQFSYADYNTYRASASVSTPVIENQVGISVSIDRSSSDGFIDNPTLNISDSGATDVTTFRAKTLITPEVMPNLSVLLGYTHIDDTARENRVVEELFGDERINTENLQSFTDTVADIGSVEINYDIGENWSVTSVSGYIENELEFFGDSTRDASGEDANSFTQTNEEIFSQELRAAYNGDRVTGLLGVYYFNRSGDTSNVNTSFVGTDFAFPDPATFAGILFSTPTPDAAEIAIATGLRSQIVGLVPEFTVEFERASDIDIENYAIFGELTVDLTEKFALTLGARYDDETIEQNVFDETIVPPLPSSGDATIDGILDLTAAQFTNAVAVENVDNSFSAFLPKAQVTYNWTENVSTSLSYQRAYRAGGLSINTFRAALAPSGSNQSDLESLGVVNSFDPEFTNNYELAFRSQWFDNDLTLNANVFYIDYTDQQVNVQLSSNPLDTLTENVGESELYGFELEAFATPFDGLDVSANVGFTSTEFSDGSDVLDDVEDFNIDITGLEFSFAPRWTAGGTVRYTFPSGLFGNARVRFTDSSFSLVTNEREFDSATGLTVNNPDLNAENDSRTTLDLTAGYDADNYRVEIFATNVTNEEFLTFNPADPNFGAIAVAGDPRVVGGRVLFEY